MSLMLQWVNLSVTYGQDLPIESPQPSWEMTMIMTTIMIVWRCHHRWHHRWHHCWSLQGRHNERDGISNHQCLNGLLNHLFRWRSKKTSKLSITSLCEGNSLVTGEFPSQRASNAENASIWWHHHVILSKLWARGLMTSPLDYLL